MILNDLSKFWEVPSVPLSGAHDVVIELFVKIVEKRHSLEYTDFKFNNDNLIPARSWYRSSLG